MLAGGGVRGGMVYGSTDKDAAYALDHPTSPEDLAATIFEQLGIDPELANSRRPGPAGAAGRRRPGDPRDSGLMRWQASIAEPHRRSVRVRVARFKRLRIKS